MPAATSSIAISSSRMAAFQALDLYLAQHGRHVTSLSLTVLELPEYAFMQDYEWDDWDDNMYMPPPQILRLRPLPCHNLAHLSIKVLDGLELVPSGGPAPPDQQPVGTVQGLLAAATGLASLSLEGPCVSAPADLVAALAALPGLQALRLQHATRLGDVWGALLGTLGGLTQLSRLQLASSGSARSPSAGGGEPLAPVFSTPTLHLEVDLGLDLEVDLGLVGQPGDAERLARLITGQSRLRHLELCSGLRGADLEPLLEAVGQLPQLHTLALVITGKQTTPPAFAGLTAASGTLTELRLNLSGLVKLCSAMFPADRTLPRLVACKLTPSGVGRCSRWRPGVLGSVVAACPNLRRLELTAAAGAGSELSALAQARHLTQLVITVHDDQGLAALAQLPALQELELTVARDATQVMPLTSLRRLRQMTLRGVKDPSLRLPFREHCTSITFPWTSNSQLAAVSVWRQLFYRLLLSPACRAGLDAQLLGTPGAGDVGWLMRVPAESLADTAGRMRDFFGSIFLGEVCESYAQAERFNMETLAAVQGVADRMWALAAPGAGDTKSELQEIVGQLDCTSFADELHEAALVMFGRWHVALCMLMAAGKEYLTQQARQQQQQPGGGNGGGDDDEPMAAPGGGA